MGLRESLSKEKTRNSIPKSKLSRKIDFRLKTIAEGFGHVLGEHFVRIEDEFFMKTVVLKGMYYIDRLTLRYTRENRLVSVSYDMQYESVVRVKEDEFREVGSCVFEVVSKGRYKTRHPEWECKSFEGDDRDRERYLRLLHSKLIMDRIEELDLKGIKVTHENGSGNFFIHAESMIGSATWILIPPLTQVIKLSKEEHFRLLEFFEMVAKVFIDNRYKVKEEAVSDVKKQ